MVWALTLLPLLFGCPILTFDEAQDDPIAPLPSFPNVFFSTNITLYSSDIETNFYVSSTDFPSHQVIRELVRDAHETFVSNRYYIVYAFSNETDFSLDINYQVISSNHIALEYYTNVLANTLTTNRQTTFSSSNGYENRYGDLEGFITVSNLLKSRFSVFQSNVISETISDSSGLGYTNGTGFVVHTTNVYFNNLLTTNASFIDLIGSNHTQIHYGDLIGYETISNLINYSFYVLQSNASLSLVEDSSEQVGYSNFIEATANNTNFYFTNFYFSNSLQTNVVSTRIESVTLSRFETMDTNFITYYNDNGGMGYTLLIDNLAGTGYSNFSSNWVVEIYNVVNAIQSFSLNSENNSPRGITAHNDKFYIINESSSNNSVYVYNDLGGYENKFDLGTNRDNANLNNFPQGITFAGDQFYITDYLNGPTRDTLFAYDTDFGSKTNFSLQITSSENRDPGGITVYNNRFCIVDTHDGRRVFLYHISNASYETQWSLHNDNGNPYGITTYRDKYYVTDSKDDAVYIYNFNGSYDSSFNLSGDVNPLGIEVYDDTFYIVDSSNNKVLIYPFN